MKGEALHVVCALIPLIVSDKKDFSGLGSIPKIRSARAYGKECILPTCVSLSFQHTLVNYVLLTRIGIHTQYFIGIKSNTLA